MKGKKRMTTNGKTHYLGVDDGHYAIKICDEDGQTFVVPSRGRTGRHVIGWRENDPDNGFYNTEEGVSYTVHPHLSQYDDTRFKEYPKSALNRVLVHHALQKAGFGGKSVSIATGLPVSYYYLADGSKDETLIEAKIANLAKGVSSGSGQPLANIKDSFVATEALAAYYDYLIAMDGSPSEHYTELSEATVGVIDIGGKTTDCAVIYPGGNQVDLGRSGSSDVGVLQLHAAVESKLRVKFELDNVPPTMVESAISRGTVKISGKEEAVGDLVRGEKEKLADDIMSVVRSKIGTGKDLDFVLFVGGGAIVMQDQLGKYFAHSRFPENPEFANARGMLKIAKYIVAGEGSEA